MRAPKGSSLKGGVGAFIEGDWGVILLAFSAYAFFSLALVLLAGLFVGMFLWNIRQMKPNDFVAALRILAGLGAVAIIILGMVAKFERDYDKNQNDLERFPPRPATGDGVDITPRFNTPVPSHDPLWAIPRDDSSPWSERTEKLRPNTTPPADQWWEE